MDGQETREIPHTSMNGKRRHLGYRLNNIPGPVNDLRSHRERLGEQVTEEAYVEPATETIRERAYAGGRS